MKFCIIGAGAAGLNTALEIQRELPNVDITVIADKFNEDTTSDGAAGLFYPVLGFKGPNLETEKYVIFCIQWFLLRGVSQIEFLLRLSNFCNLKITIYF